MSLPLFPLPNVVLLPGLVLPLYVFEPRYRDLLARVRRSGEPFGITRLGPALDEGTPFVERVGTVGTLAYVREVVDHADGTASILVVGGDRFEVKDFDTSESYLSADVEVLPMETGDPVVIGVLGRTVLQGVVDLHRENAEKVRAGAPKDPLLLSTYCAALMPLTAEQGDEVLRAPSVADRFEVLASLIPSRTLN
ncbi:LON peptidase substrate-binding domain-containing protein [Deinococcus pimensis]|uniref:LON peptidase substrate-binding domain-containing protein n=1 Tax=Deinococcus pimensis TaxID=309888 RepID=UPI0004890D39|nr:LON peptidase substrate-binding domain-containing protein [Deinococcus pimensis]